MTRSIADIGVAVIGTGFIGTVHVEALRRIGVQVRGVLGSTPERGQARATALGVPRAYPSLDALLDDPSVDAVHVTSPNDLHLPQAKAVLAAGRHVICEKPLAMSATESAELVERGRGDRARERGELQHPLLPAEPARARGRELGRHRRRPSRHRALLPGLAAARHRLELAPGAGPGRRPPRGRRHRVALAGPDGLHHRPTDRRGHGRAGDLRAGARREPTGPVETFSTEAADRDRHSRHRDRGRRDDPAALRERRPWVGQRQPDQRRPQELAPVRDRRVVAPRWPGTRSSPTSCGSAIASGPNEILLKNPALMGAGRAGRRGAPRRPRGRASRTRSPPTSVPCTRTSSPAGPPLGPVTRPSPTATTRCSSTTRWPRARDSVAGWTWFAIPPMLAIPWRPDPDEARPADRPVPRHAAHGRRRLDGGQRLRQHRDRVLAADDRPDATVCRHVPHRRREPVREPGDRARRRDRRQGPVHLRSRLLPEPAPPRSGASRRGHRPPQACHHRRREDGGPARQHLHGRGRREDSGRQLGGGPSRLAGHRGLRAGPRPEDHPRELPDAVLATTSGRAGTTSRRRPACGGGSSRRGAGRSGSTSTRRTSSSR